MGNDSVFTSAFNFLFSLSSPVQILLIIAGVFVIRKIVQSQMKEPPPEPTEERLEPMKKRDFTMEELKPYDGLQEKRVLLAVNGKVFDVTRGKDFYGPGGPYSIFGGRDASRGLATFSLGPEALKDEYDDLSDLNSMQMESVREWEAQFTEKYDMIGNLLKPGEKHQQYEESETEDEDKTGKKEN